MGIKPRTNYLLVAVASILLLATATSCSSSPGSSSKTSDGSRKDIKTELSAFSKDVLAICSGLDEGAVLSITEIGVGASKDPSSMAETLKTSENEMDHFISLLELVEPPEKYKDDWETFLDENAEIRDTFPDLAKLLSEVGQTQSRIVGDSSDQNNAMLESE